MKIIMATKNPTLSMSTTEICAARKYAISLGILANFSDLSGLTMK